MINNFLSCLGVTVCFVTALTNAGFAAPAVKKPIVAKKTPAKVGIRKTPQMAGAVGRFGELYGLKSGWTFEILSARTSYDAFDDYGGLFAANGKKLLILQVTIKNNTPDDLYFDSNLHQFQIQDATNQTYAGGSYRLSSTTNASFSPSLKPGQGAGQDPKNRLEVAIPIDDEAKVTKIILQQGRKGSKEEVTRYFVAGTQGGDPKNVVKPAKGENSTAPIKAEGFFPSRTFQFRINGVSFISGPIAGNEALENRRFAIVNLTVKNPTTISEGYYDFLGTWFDKVFFTDADGENYQPSSDIGLLKGSSDEQTGGEFTPGQEKSLRLVFPVPQNGELKTLSFGATDGKQWLFDASAWK